MVISIKLYLTIRNLTPFIRIGSYRPTLYLFKMTKPCPFDPPRVFFRPNGTRYHSERDQWGGHTMVPGQSKVLLLEIAHKAA